MPGFLSTLNPPLARSASGAAADRTANRGEPQAFLKTGKSGGYSSFQSAFAKTDRVSPSEPGAPRKTDADQNLAQSESGSGEQGRAESVEDASLDAFHESDEEASVDTSEQDQANLDGMEGNPDDSTIYGFLEPPVLGAVSSQARQVGETDRTLGSTGVDVLEDPALEQVATRPISANLMGESDIGRTVDEGAHQPPFGGFSAGNLPVQPALSERSGAGTRGTSSLQAQDAPIPHGLHQADQAAASAKINLGSSLHPVSPDGSMLLQSTATISKEAVAPDRRSSTTEVNARTAMITISDSMRMTVSAKPEPIVNTFALGMAEGNEDGQTVISLNDPVVTGDLRPAQTSADLRMSTVAGGGSPQMARHVATQLAEAAVKVSGRPIDLALNPSELGRVRITLTPGDGGLVVSVSAERSETLDLMRRHIDVLDQEFRDLGYGGTNFTFSKEQDGANQVAAEALNDKSRSDDVSSSETDHETLRNVSAVISDRLDVRL